MRPITGKTHEPSLPCRRNLIAAAIASALAAGASFPTVAADSGAPLAAPVVVTATRVEQSSFDLPMAIDSLEAGQIRAQKPAVNISESLVRVPGTVIQNRETYAQEQQVVIRGFGARSQFGVRSVKLIADGIPASTPDGQGGSGLFDLASARSIEVLRGPFSALYGNHSGGVVQVLTEDGPPQPTLSGDFVAGSYGTRKTGLKFGGQADQLNYTTSLSQFETHGYRQWSEARKDQLNAKFRYDLDPKSSWTVVLNYLDQPNNQDPLGLTAAELARDRRAASSAATDFKTRRSLDNQQAGLVYEGALSSTDTLRATAYIGNRSNEQFLAVPESAENSIRHSGGVSTFDRDFGGLNLRWTRKLAALTLTTGGEYERAEDARKGYRNDGGGVRGTRGALKRNEENTVWQSGLYGQAEWQPAADWSVSGGLRYTRVDFDSKDKFICTTSQVTAPGTTANSCSGATSAISATNFNPDDSGSAKYSAWTPVAGVLYHLTPTVNLYASAGRSFEAPTFIELAYKTDANDSGLNLALKPSKSTHYEVGAKAFVGSNARVNLALFRIDSDNELVVFSNTGGRTTYQNAGKTGRQGLELSLDGKLGAGFAAYLAASYLDAKFEQDFRTCVPVAPATTCASPNTTVSAGKRIPGIPRYQVYGELSWRHEPAGFAGALEGRWTGKVQANDINTVSVDDYFVANVRAGFEQQLGKWRLSEYARVDNVLNEKYIGAVYVNDVNGRYFAPAAERSSTLGISASLSF